MQVYKCKKNCHIRIYPLWVGEEAEPCPRCSEDMIYRGDMTQEQLEQMQRDIFQSKRVTNSKQRKIKKPKNK